MDTDSKCSINYGIDKTLPYIIEAKLRDKKGDGFLENPNWDFKRKGIRTCEWTMTTDRLITKQLGLVLIF